jgi:hypothetical protein
MVKQTLKQCNNIIQKEHRWKYTHMNPVAPNLHATIKLHKQNTHGLAKKKYQKSIEYVSNNRKAKDAEKNTSQNVLRNNGYDTNLISKQPPSRKTKTEHTPIRSNKKQSGLPSHTAAKK